MPYGVYVMMLDLEKASGAKGKQMGEDKMGDWHLNKGIREK